MTYLVCQRDGHTRRGEQCLSEIKRSVRVRTTEMGLFSTLSWSTLVMVMVHWATFFFLF